MMVNTSNSVEKSSIEVPTIIIQQPTAPGDKVTIVTTQILPVEEVDRQFRGG
jgi:hypothetical protein